MLRPGSPPARLIRHRGLPLALCGGLLAALLVLVLYWPARENGFVADDWLVVVGLANSIAAISWWEALLRPPGEYAVLFRPLPMLTFLLQLWAGQTGPQSFHLVNIVIHAANVFLLTLVSWRLLSGEPLRPAHHLVLAALCGLLYGTHPALTEPVIWISARSDLVMTFLLCLALLSDRLLPEHGWNRALATGACFFAAMLSKESAVGFMLALPIVHLAFDRVPPGAHDAGVLPKAWMPHYRVYAVLLLAFMAYLTMRFAVSGPAMGLDQMNSPARHIESFGQHVLVVVASLSHQVWAAIWPFQSIVPSRQLPLPIDAMQLLPAVAACAGALALAFLTARAGGAGRVAALLFLAFFASLIPVANIVPIPAVSTPVEVAIAPRYLTFPLIFACLVVPFALRLLETLIVKRQLYRRALLWTIMGLWILAAVAFDRTTIPLWKDDLAMYAWALRQGAPSFWRYRNIGGHYLGTGDLVRAREAFAAAVKLRDDEYTAGIWHSLGAVEAGLGNSAQALRALRRAVALAPENARARALLAAILREAGEFRLAVGELEEGLNRIRASGRPDGQERLLRYELGLAYAGLGRTDDAIAHLIVALALARGEEERRTFETALKSIASRR